MQKYPQRDVVLLPDLLAGAGEEVLVFLEERLPGLAPKESYLWILSPQTAWARAITHSWKQASPPSVCVELAPGLPCAWPGLIAAQCQT